MQVFTSEHGSVVEGKVITETLKGYRVARVHEGRPDSERLVYRVSPNGCHRTFLTRGEADADALEYIEREEEMAFDVLERMDTKRQKLLSA